MKNTRPDITVQQLKLIATAQKFGATLHEHNQNPGRYAIGIMVERLEEMIEQIVSDRIEKLKKRA